MRNPMVLALGLVLGTLSLAQPASAFGDCMEKGFLTDFYEAPTAEDIVCVELFRFSVPTPDGTREIRGIADAAVDWAAPPDLVAEAERGARLAGNAFAGLGRFAIDDVTILILDDVYATEELSNHGTGDEVLGVALSDRKPDPMRPHPECLITIYALASPATDGSMATTVAHEIFHCLQGATYPGPKYQSYGEGGDWWIEGAAEAFAAAAIPDSAAYTDRSGDFDGAVEARTALNDMAHESAIFFYWLLQDRGGLAALMPFQDAMADTGGAGAQQAAMRGAMSPEEWAAFAQSYADGRILHPQGGGLSSVAPVGTALVIEATARHSLPLAAFTLTLGRVDYGCGVWGNTPLPESPMLSWKDDAVSDGDWRALPGELDTRDGDDLAWRLVALPVDDALAEGELEVERRHSCTPCLGVDRLDACLIGTWEQSGGGPAEWMEAQGFPGNPELVGDPQMSLRADGVFGTHGFGVRITDVNAEGVIEGQGRVFGAFGAWSATDGKLNMCATAGGGMSGTTTVTTEDGSGSFNSGRSGGGEFSVSYSCSATDLSTSLQMRGFPDMNTTYRKVGE